MVKNAGLRGSPSSTAVFAPAGIDAGASTHGTSAALNRIGVGRATANDDVLAEAEGGAGGPGGAVSGRNPAQATAVAATDNPNPQRLVFIAATIP